MMRCAAANNRPPRSPYSPPTLAPQDQRSTAFLQGFFELAAVCRSPITRSSLAEFMPGSPCPRPAVLHRAGKGDERLPWMALVVDHGQTEEQSSRHEDHDGPQVVERSPEQRDHRHLGAGPRRNTDRRATRLRRLIEEARQRRQVDTVAVFRPTDSSATVRPAPPKASHQDHIPASLESRRRADEQAEVLIGEEHREQGYPRGDDYDAREKPEGCPSNRAERF